VSCENEGGGNGRGEGGEGGGEGLLRWAMSVSEDIREKREREKRRAHLLEDFADTGSNEQARVDSGEERLEDSDADELVGRMVVVEVGE
jgi:hypothetical protein